MPRNDIPAPNPNLVVEEQVTVRSTPAGDPMRPVLSRSLRDRILRRDAEFAQPDAHTVVRVRPKNAPDVGDRTLNVVIDGKPATLTLNAFDLVTLLNSTPIKH